jgi:predicted enzyme related to lactoylglutathione lyase
MQKKKTRKSNRRDFIGTIAAGTASLLVPVAFAGSDSNGATCPVVHFEVGCKDLEKTTAFYTGLFGWEQTPIPSASLLNTTSSEGIQGHITSLGHEPHQYVTFYIQVDDINAMLKKITEAGGTKIIGPIPLPDKTQFAWFKDPEGNMVALTTKA